MYEDIDSANVINNRLTTREELGEAYRTMHAFAHASLFESCSNSLLQALASGLPTLYVDSGSNKQLVRKHGVELTNDPNESIAERRDNYQTLRSGLLDEVDNYSITHEADNYEKIFPQLPDK